VVADVGRVVAGGAGAHDERGGQVVIQPGHAGDPDRAAVEDRLAPGDRALRWAAGAGPGVEEMDRHRVERRAPRVVAERVGDPQEEPLLGLEEEERPALGAAGVEWPGGAALRLR